MTDEVILVDAHDRELGIMEKLEAHKKGLLHRAFSVLIFNSKKEILLQKRVESKYHSGGLWTNACCSHPKPNESVENAAQRRLMEEMGIDLRPQFLYKFIYKIAFDNKMTEHEYDHVLIGRFDGEPILNPQEAADWRYVDLDKLKEDIEKNPESYTSWFKMIMENITPHLQSDPPKI